VLRGYDVNALHFLIKPASPAKLLPILDKALAIWRARRSTVLVLSDRGGHLKLPVGEILYITMQSHIAIIHMDGAVIETRQTMSELLESLPENFVQTHRSYIVNLYKVDCVYKESLILSNAVKLPVSRKNTKDVNDAFLRLHMER
jgi:DNA-binding LytR/AlgR family response regulator